MPVFFKNRAMYLSAAIHLQIQNKRPVRASCFYNMQSNGYRDYGKGLIGRLPRLSLSPCLYASGPCMSSISI